MIPTLTALMLAMPATGQIHPQLPPLDGVTVMVDTLAHELGHATAIARYYGGVVSFELKPYGLTLRTGDGYLIDIRPYGLGFITFGPYKPGTTEKQKEEMMENMYEEYSENPEAFFASMTEADAYVSAAGPLMGSVTAALLGSVGLPGAFMAWLVNACNFLPQEIHGQLLDGLFTWELTLMGKYPWNEYVADWTVIGLAGLASALEDEPEVPYDLAIALFTVVYSGLPELADDVYKILLGEALGLKVKLRSLFVNPISGAGLNFSFEGSEWLQRAVALVDALTWLVVMPFLPEDFRIGALLAKMNDLCLDTWPAYPALGSLLGTYLSSLFETLYLVLALLG